MQPLPTSPLSLPAVELQPQQRFSHCRVPTPPLASASPRSGARLLNGTPPLASQHATLPVKPGQPRGCGNIDEVFFRLEDNVGLALDEIEPNSDQRTTALRLKAIVAAVPKSVRAAPEGQDSARRKAEHEEARQNLAETLATLEELRRDGARFHELTHVVNEWGQELAGGVFRLIHHGVILKSATHGYLSIDFGRYGIEADLSDEHPGFPEGTVQVKTYSANIDPTTLMHYCSRTDPFSFTGNNCRSWTRGLLNEVGLSHAAVQDTGVLDWTNCVKPAALSTSTATVTEKIVYKNLSACLGLPI